MGVQTHSFATGPVMAEPFISPLGFTMTPALSYKDEYILDVLMVSSWVETCLKVEEEPITPTPGFALADYDDRHSYTYVKWVRMSWKR